MITKLGRSTKRPFTLEPGERSHDEDAQFGIAVIINKSVYNPLGRSWPGDFSCGALHTTQRSTATGRSPAGSFIRPETAQ